MHWRDYPRLCSTDNWSQIKSTEFWAPQFCKCGTSLLCFSTSGATEVSEYAGKHCSSSQWDFLRVERWSESQFIIKSCCFYLWNIAYLHLRLSITTISVVKATPSPQPAECLQTESRHLRTALAPHTCRSDFFKKCKSHHLLFIFSFPLLKSLQWLSNTWRTEAFLICSVNFCVTQHTYFLGFIWNHACPCPLPSSYRDLDLVFPTCRDYTTGPLHMFFSLPRWPSNHFLLLMLTSKTLFEKKKKKKKKKLLLISADLVLDLSSSQWSWVSYFLAIIWSSVAPARLSYLTLGVLMVLHFSQELQVILGGGGLQTGLYSENDCEAGCLQLSFGDQILVGMSGDRTNIAIKHHHVPLGGAFRCFSPTGFTLSHSLQNICPRCPRAAWLGQLAKVLPSWALEMQGVVT